MNRAVRGGLGPAAEVLGDDPRRGYAAVVRHGAGAAARRAGQQTRGFADVDAHDIEHGTEEHAEGNEALLAVLELKGTDTKSFVDAVEELSNKVAHHVAEEELSIIEPARSEVSDQVRRELGAKWAARRNELIDADCGSLESVRRIVAAAEQEGLLDE